MSVNVSRPRVVDLVRGALVWEADPGCCDLCRSEAPLFRLIHTVDALCARCFGAWHG